MLILGREEINMMADTTSQNNLQECDSCVPNVCLHGGVCQVSITYYLYLTFFM